MLSTLFSSAGRTAVAVWGAEGVDFIELPHLAKIYKKPTSFSFFQRDWWDLSGLWLSPIFFITTLLRLIEIFFWMF
jgi:hypothetical protein